MSPSCLAWRSIANRALPDGPTMMDTMLAPESPAPSRGRHEGKEATPLLVFVHIPKTAGTTLRTVLSMNEPGSRSRALANVFKGGGGISTRMIERLRKGSGPDLGNVRLLRGHFPLGIREYLPKDREVRCFTFLREPADRTLSHYFAIREIGRGYGLPPLPAEATVDDALEGGYIHDNLQTRMLSGDPEPFGEVTDEMLERAKRNLRGELVFFGLTERFDESLVLAKLRLGFRGILYRTSGRVNPERPRGGDVPKGLLEQAERCNRYDIELYRYAEELFDDSPELGQLDIEAELAALRAAKGDGEIQVDAPAPEGFDGNEVEWRMLVEARATAQRLEWDRTRHRIPHVEPTVQDEAREEELKATRSRTKELEREIERLQGARSKTRKLEQEIEILKGARLKAKRLEQEVERLEGESSRAGELQKEVERLEAAASRTQKLERQVERIGEVRSRNKELEQEVERLTKRTKRLEQQVDRLKGARARKRKLEQKVERLRPAAGPGS